VTSARDTARFATAEQAAEWYLRHREGSVDGPEQEAFQHWVSESPLHVEEYLGVARLVALLPEAGDDPDFDIERLVELAKADPVTELDPVSPARPRPARALSARPVAFARLGFAAASLLMMLGAGLLWWNWWQGRVTVVAYASDHGVVRSFTLPDHSLLQLDSDSRVTVRYGRNAREVELLRGQAYLEVARDPGRTFDVFVGAVRVRDVGTHFNVYRKEPMVEVTIQEGAVSVGSASAAAVIARAGQQATVPLQGGAVLVKDVNADAALAWRSGRLVFRDRPLSEVVDEFNRYSEAQIEIDSPGLGNLPVSGVISVQDVTSFMAFLGNLPGVTVAAVDGHISVTRAQ
jgi:transmembrane sensor